MKKLVVMILAAAPFALVYACDDGSAARDCTDDTDCADLAATPTCDPDLLICVGGADPICEADLDCQIRNAFSDPDSEDATCTGNAECDAILAGDICGEGFGGQGFCLTPGDQAFCSGAGAFDSANVTPVGGGADVAVCVGNSGTCDADGQCS